MKKIIKSNWLQTVFVFFSAVIFFGANSAQTITAQVGGCDCVPDEVIFELLNPANLPAIAAQYGLNATPLGQVGTPPTFRMRIISGAAPTDVIAMMQSDGRITKSEVNRKLSAVEREGLPWTQGQSWSVGVRSKSYARQWFPNKIRLTEAHNSPSGSRGAGVTVAVLDTGIDLRQSAFAGKLVPGYDFVNNDTNPSEEGALRQGVYGHGTHVAGIIALTAPEAKIMPLRVLDSNGEGELWRVSAAIIWAAEHGADIVNISFGYPEQALILKDLADFCDDGLTPDGKNFSEVGAERLAFIIAAGNGGRIGNGTSFIFPAAERAFSVSGILAVGASTAGDKLAAFSTMSDGGGSGGDRWVRSVAPGESIVSALPGKGFATWSGTSMAAPIAAGVAALVKSRNPNMAPIDLVDRIDDTGVEWECFHPTRGITLKTSRVDALCAVTNNQNCGFDPNVCQISFF